MIAQVPELADGGYWYVVEAVLDPGEGGRTPGDIPSGWCAWYREIEEMDCVAVRMPEPAVIPEGPGVSVAQIVGEYGGKPFGRVRGR